MSESSAPNGVVRLVPGFAIFALVVMIMAAIFHVAMLSPAPTPAFDRLNAPPAPDFTDNDSWLRIPETDLPGGWERPWGVDLIWFSDTPGGYLGGWNAPINWSATDTQLASMDWLETEDPDQFGIYAPRRRHMSSLTGDEADAKAAAELEREDVFAGLERYLDEFNSSRGIFVGGTGTGLEAALSVIEDRLADADPYRTLFGGIVVSPSQKDLPESFPPWPDCEDTITEFPCVLDLRTAANSEDAQNKLERTVLKFSGWLDESATKPAAPLPPMQSIELSPVRRPGETEPEPE